MWHVYQRNLDKRVDENGKELEDFEPDIFIKEFDSLEECFHFVRKDIIMANSICPSFPPIEKHRIEKQEIAQKHKGMIDDVVLFDIPFNHEEYAKIYISSNNTQKHVMYTTQLVYEGETEIEMDKAHYWKLCAIDLRNVSLLIPSPPLLD